MDNFDVDDFTALNFDSEFETFLGNCLGLGDVGLPASRSAGPGNQVEQGTGITTASTSGTSSQHGRQAQTYSSVNIISPQCPACRKYQADIDRLDQDHRLNFRMLKQKVTGTDLLIRRFKSMRDDYKLQGKTIQNLNLQLEKVTRDSTILSEQLQSVMKEVKPLKDENEHLLKELEKKNIDNERLLDRIQAEEAYKCQKSFLDERNRMLEAEATVLKRQNNNLSSRVHTLEINSRELDRERKALKSTGNIYVKRMEHLALALYKAQTILDSLWRRFSYYDGIVDGETKPDLIPKNFKALVRKAVKDHGYKNAAHDHQLSRDNSLDNSQENSLDNACDARPPSDDSEVSEFEDMDAVDDQGVDAIPSKDTRKSLVSPSQSFNKDEEERITKPTGPTSNGESMKRAPSAKVPGKQTTDPLKTDERESCDGILNRNDTYKTQPASGHKSVADIDAQKTQPASGNKSVTDVDIKKQLRGNGLANPIKTVVCENNDKRAGKGSQLAPGTGVMGAIPQLAISTKTVRQIYTVVSAPHLKLPPKGEVGKTTPGVGTSTKTPPAKANGAAPSAKLVPKPVTQSAGTECNGSEGGGRVPEIKATRPDLADDLNMSSDSLSSGSLSSCSEDEKGKDNVSSRVRKDVSSRVRKDNVSSRVRKDNVSSRVRKDNVSSRIRKDNVSSRVRKDSVSSCGKRDASVSSKASHIVEVSQRAKANGFGAVTRRSSSKVDDTKLNALSGFKSKERLSSASSSHESDDAMQRASTMSTTDKDFLKTSSHELETSVQNGTPRTVLTGGSNTLSRDILSSCSSSDESEDEERPAVNKGSPKLKAIVAHESREIPLSSRLSDDSDHDSGPAFKKVSVKMKNKVVTPALKKTFKQRGASEETRTKCSSVEAKQNTRYVLRSHSKQNQTGSAVTHGVLTGCVAVSSEQNQAGSSATDSVAVTDSVVTHSVLTDNVVKLNDVTDSVAVSGELGLKDAAKNHNKNNDEAKSQESSAYTVHNHPQPTVHVSILSHINELCDSFILHDTNILSDLSDGPDSPNPDGLKLSDGPDGPHPDGLKLSDGPDGPNPDGLKLSDGPDGPHPDSLMDVCEMVDSTTDSGEMVLLVQPSTRALKVQHETVNTHCAGDLDLQDKNNELSNGSKLVYAKGMPTSAFIAANGVQMIENILPKHDDSDITKCSNKTVQINDVNITDSSDDIVSIKEAHFTNGSVDTVQIHSKVGSIATSSQDTVQTNSSGDTATVSQKLNRNASTGLTLEGVRIKSWILSKSENPLTVEDPSVPPENFLTAEDPQAPPENLLTVEDPQAPPQNPLTVEDPQEPSENPLTVEDPQEPSENPLTAEDPQVPPENLTVEDPQAPPENLLTVEDPQAPPQNPLTVEDPQVPPENPLTVEDPQEPPENPLTAEDPQDPPENPLTVEDPQDPPENPLTVEDPQEPSENPLTAEDPQVPPENLTVEDPQEPPENPLTAEDPQDPPENPLTVEDPQEPPENPLTAEDPQDPPENPLTVEDPQEPPENPLTAEDPQEPSENPLTVEDHQEPPENPLTAEDPQDPPENPLTVEDPQEPPENFLTIEDPQVPPENLLTVEDPQDPPENLLTVKDPQVPPENLLTDEDPQVPPENLLTNEDPQVPPENLLTAEDPKVPPENLLTVEDPQFPPENLLTAEDPQVPPADLVSTNHLPLEDPNSCCHTETSVSSKLLDTLNDYHSASTLAETKTKMAPRFASLFVMSPDSAFTAVRSPQYVAKNPFSSDVKALVPETNLGISHTNDNNCVKSTQQNLSGPKKRILHTSTSAVSSTKNKILKAQITGEGARTVRTKESFLKASVSFQTSAVGPATNKCPLSTDTERKKLPEMFLHNICDSLQISASKAPFLPFGQQQKHSQPKHPIIKKRKLSFSQPTSPQPSDFLCDTSFDFGGGEQATLSQIFNYFKRPRLLSPLPPSPVVVSEESCDSLVKFDCSTPADVIKVTPLAKALEMTNSHKSLSTSRPGTAEAKSHPIATSTRRSTIVSKRAAEHKVTPPARQQEAETKPGNKLMRERADDDKLIPLGRSPRVASNVKAKSLSHQMMEVNKLILAKRNAAVSGKPVSQEAPRGVKRKMEVTKADQGAVTKRKKLANINGFPNAFEAVMFDLKHFLEEPKTDVHLTIDAMLNRVAGGDGQGIWQVLPHVVVQYLATQTDKTMDLLLAACDKEEIIEQVFVSEAERRLLDLLCTLMKAYQDTDKSCMISVAWTAIFNQGAMVKPARVFLCRLFTSLCKAQADLEQARVLVYNIAWCGYLDLAPLYMAIAGVWPEVFSHNHVTRQCAMSPVLDYLLRDTYKSHPKVLRQVQCVLQRLCLWDTRQTTVEPEKLLKALYEKLLYHFANAKNSLKPGYIFEVSKAIELLLIYQGAAWTMGNFTQRILLSLAMKWEHNGDTEKGPSPELVVAMMGVFRAVVAVQPLLVNSLKIISQIFERFIARKSTNMSVELAYVNALLEISPYNPEKCLDLLRKWQDNNKGKVPNQTFSNLLQVRTMLTQKSGRGRDSKR